MIWKKQPVGSKLADLQNNKASKDTATQNAAGLMSASDKTKLDGVATGATAVSVVNNLNSDSTTSALSAAQGKALNSNKIETSAIKNNVTTTSSGYVLDARQGKVIYDRTTTTDISSAITWGNAYTTGDDPDAHFYSCGNVRMLIVSFTPKSANSDWQTILTVNSGHRPQYIFYGSAITSAAATPVVKTVRMSTGGVLEIYSRTANAFKVTMTYIV